MDTYSFQTFVKNHLEELEAFRNAIQAIELKLQGQLDLFEPETELESVSELLIPR